MDHPTITPIRRRGGIVTVLCLAALAIPALSSAQTCDGLVATVVGTEGDDQLVGTQGDDVIVGLGGNDDISLLDGNDVACGGGGDDVIFGGDGSDRLFGDEGNDDLRGENDNDSLAGGSGDDSLRGGSGDDQMAGDDGDDVMLGTDGSDSCDGVTGIDSADRACETRANLDADVLFLTRFADDGTQLDGELYVPTGDGAAQGTRSVAWLFRHGAQGNYASGVNQSAGLWGVLQGFTVLSLNGRDWGTAAGGGNTLFEDTTLDMGVGIDFLERLGFSHVFVAGHSGGTQAAGVYPALSSNDPRMAAVGLFGVVADGRDAATEVLFLPSSLYEGHVADSERLIAEGQGEVVRDYLTSFGISLQRSPRTFLSYWGPDTRSVVEREITAAQVPVLILRADGDEFTPDRYSVAVRDAAVAAGVDATYLKLPFRGNTGPSGINAHALLGVERQAFQDTIDWLASRVPEASTWITGVPVRQAGNYLPLADAGRSARLVSGGGERHTLDGRNSLDLDGPLTYAWAQIGGKRVELRDAASPVASFQVPASSTTLRFALTVTDEEGATDTDTVSVEVASINPPGGGSTGDAWMLALLTGLALARAGGRQVAALRRAV